MNQVKQLVGYFSRFLIGRALDGALTQPPNLRLAGHRNEANGCRAD